MTIVFSIASGLGSKAERVTTVALGSPSQTLPMLIEQTGGTPLLYRWIDLPQIPEMFLEHLSA